MSIKDIRNQLAAKQRQHGAATPNVVKERPLVIRHTHDAQFCYLQVDPPPSNGLVRFTLAEYQALQAEMKKVEASFTARR